RAGRRRAPRAGPSRRGAGRRGRRTSAPRRASRRRRSARNSAVGQRAVRSWGGGSRSGEYNLRPPMDSPVTPNRTTASASDVDLANAIRALAMDAVEAAKSGHPGMPMGMAEIAVALWGRHLRHNPANPAWPNRDRFVVSNGHGSMLLYSLLHLTGYALPIEELKRFRQLGSKTPGHPEYGYAPGVETTTGPLGQGFANAVG